jgi:flagellar hook-length control protein FliK
MALVSEKTETSKAAPKHGRLLPVQGAFQKTLASKAKAAGASSAVDKNGSTTKAALAKALQNLRKGVHSDGKQAAGEPASGGAKVAQAQAHAPASAIGAVVQAQAAKLILDPGEAAEAAEGGHTSKKKTAAQTAKHTDGLATLPGLPGPAPTVAGPGTLPGNEGETVRVAAASHAAARKSAEIKVHVVDARKKTMDSPAPSDDSPSGVKGPAASSSEKNTALPGVARNGTETVVQEPRRQSHSAPTASAGALERLREMAGSELVRAAGIVLRDGGGEIKLTLKPESLGSVRIRMNLVDNAIEGRIIVDNSAVKHAFEGSLDSLMRALTAEGFQTASLSVSVGGQNADNGRQDDRDAAPRVRRVGAAQGFDRNVPGVESLSLGDLLVNLFV